MKLAFAMLLLAEDESCSDLEPAAIVDWEEDGSDCKDGEVKFEVPDDEHFETLVEFIRQDFERAYRAARRTCCPVCNRNLSYHGVTLESFNEMLKTAKYEYKEMGSLSRLYVS